MRLSLGCVAGAVVYGSPPGASAQEAPEDSARAHADTTPPADTGQRRVSRADSILLSYHPDTTKIKAPLAHAEQPPLLSVGPSYHWGRDELFASGALTLADLLSRIPGFSDFRSGWISDPMVGTYIGDAARIRVFYDGIELDPVNARTRGVHDLAAIQLWTLEEVGVERGANQLRVYLRSWRVDHTTPYSRADVSTGSQETNWYRAYYGQRFGRGAALQIGAQQFTNTGRFGGGGAETSLLGRVGWASGPWSVDAYADRYRRGQDPLTRLDLTGNPFPDPGLPDFEGTWTDAYVRGGYGDPDRGVWAQLIASTQEFKNSSTRVLNPLDTSTAAKHTIDSTHSEAQYVAAGGFSRWGIRFSGTERLRVYAAHGLWSTPSGRASLESGPLALSVFAEQNAPTVWPTLDRVNRFRMISYSTQEASARLTPVSFLSVAGTLSRSSSSGVTDAPPTAITMRGEAGVQLGRLWFSGGLITRDAARVAALAVYDSSYAPVSVGRVTGTFGSIRGVVWNALNADITGTNWGSEGPYRPHYQARAELFLKSEWLSRFPRHTFSILAAGVFDYRTPVLFPIGTSSVFQSSTNEAAISTLLEIRILHATLTWQFRNVTGYLYNLVPGYIMPRQTNLYGVRWSFWN